MKKKVLSVLLTVAMTATLLAGCGNNSQPAGTSNQPASDTQTGADAQTDDGNAAADTAAEIKGTITVAASQTPHSEILAEAAKILKELKENNKASTGAWKVVEKGASLIGKVDYSMEKRQGDGRDNPKYLDCSSFTFILKHPTPI